jgi:hypothetical protein
LVTGAGVSQRMDQVGQLHWRDQRQIKSVGKWAVGLGQAWVEDDTFIGTSAASSRVRPVLRAGRKVQGDHEREYCF